MMTLANRLASLIILLLLSCSSPEKNLVNINGNTMGTTYTVKFFHNTGRRMIRMIEYLFTCSGTKIDEGMITGPYQLIDQVGAVLNI